MKSTPSEQYELLAILKKHNHIEHPDVIDLMWMTDEDREKYEEMIEDED